MEKVKKQEAVSTTATKTEERMMLKLDGQLALFYWFELLILRGIARN